MVYVIIIISLLVHYIIFFIMKMGKDKYEIPWNLEKKKSRKYILLKIPEIFNWFYLVVHTSLDNVAV